MKNLTTILAAGAIFANSAILYAQNYPIVDTGQDHCYNTYMEINCPSEGEQYYGQDSQYEGLGPAYVDNGDGTISDLITGLMWQKTPDLENQPTYQEAIDGADTCSIGGYIDWRLPTIKELYSLIDFRGETRMNAESSIPYIDTSYFDFCYGDEDSGDRFIDAQYWTATQYVGTVFDGVIAIFGVNFADGRIKGYPRDLGRDGQIAHHFVRYVRGNIEYGQNSFIDNEDGTVTDLSTGLMWQMSDGGQARNWESALEYAENLELAGYSDWRLPNVKELESIIDYSRAPDATDSDQIGPAIDPVFEITNIGDSQEPEYGFYWANTTHLDGPNDSYAAYVSFGRGLGWMERPPGSGNFILENVHGAGCQRSDPKSGNPDDYPHGHGPQGDVIRIYNMVRCVRGVSTTDSRRGESEDVFPSEIVVRGSYPNPFNGTTVVNYILPFASDVDIEIFDSLGRNVVSEKFVAQNSGTQTFSWSPDTFSSGLYFFKVYAGDLVGSTKLVLIK